MTTKRGRGRPRSTNPRSAKFNILLTQSEKAALALNSGRLGLTLAEAVREALRAYGLLPPERPATGAPEKRRVGSPPR